MKKKRRKNRMLIITGVLLIILIISNYSIYTLTYRNMDAKLSSSQMQLSESQNHLNKLQNELKVSVVNRLPDPMKSSFKIDSSLIKNIHNVMIVAHPDDETLWAGNNLSKGGYLVVCLTNGNNKIRSKEFKSVMKRTGNYGIILNYPDAVKHIKDDWGKVKNKIKEDIDYIINYKKWDRIVTHNPDGEYGHIQHKSTSYYVTNECVKYNLTDNLYYFEKYYTIKYLQKNYKEPTLTDEQIAYKNNIMTNIYKSQTYADSLFKHMIPYEKLINYKNWTFGLK